MITKVSSWRDYAHKLTPDQIDTIEHWDAYPPPPPEPLPPGWSHEVGLICMARTFILEQPWWRRWLPAQLSKVEQ